jgi:hypothetical protein
VLQEIFSNKKLVTYIGINIVISALTALIVIALWTRLTLGATPVLPSGTAVGAAFAGQLRITAIVGADDLDTERVTIEHIGDEDVSLSGWRLRDTSGAEFRFPALVLHPGAQVIIYSQAGDDTATQLYWDRQIPVWTSGETASLLDPSGQLQASYVVP